MSEDIFAFDEEIRGKEGRLLAGLDEAGRGPLAGPVVAAAVVFPQGVYLSGLKDSKRLTALQRERLYQEIIERATTVGVGVVAPDDIDRLNIYQATREAMMRAIEKLEVEPDVLVIDAMKLPLDIKQYVFTRAEDRSASVAASSVIAKVTRDRIMLQYHDKYPEYGFDRHKGYATKEHLEVLKKLGPSPIHRRSFSPVSSLKLPF